ncbi:MAG: FAD-dependent oxidoreductase [Methanoculleaceae archaeon]
MPDVVVVGGGVTGIQAALDLASHGVRVHMVEREPTIGGHMAQLDKTFPTNDCSMCILSPKMVDVSRNPKITIYTCAEVESIEGEAGSFTVRIRIHPRYVDPERCNGCGDCTQICPVEVYNKFDAGIGVRPAIYKPHPQAIPDIPIRDPEHCIDCGLCYDICTRNAILHDDEDHERVIEVPAASVIVATGYNLFDARKKTQYRYIHHPDVITSLEFERMINAAGPTGGEIRRLSNGATPSSVVFIQCVGSRDVTVNRPYCSGVCCMAAIKNATLIREKLPDTDVTICYIDIRAYGKGYEEYLERAKALGVRFIRGLPGGVIPCNGDLHLQIEDTETGEVEMLNADLVVLSVGMEPPEGVDLLASRLGIPLEDTGFFQPSDQKTAPVQTIRDGIYLAGTATAPRDIPDCVAMGQAAAYHAWKDCLQVK